MNLFVAAVLFGSHARASAQWIQRDASEGVSIRVAPELVEVAARLDAMLPAPTTRFEGPIDVTLDRVDALAAAPTRYVVLVEGDRVEVVDRTDRRIVSRVLEPGLLVREPYIGALVAVELLEVVGAVTPADDPAPAEEPIPDATHAVVETAPVVPSEVIAEPAAPRPTFELTTGGIASRGLGAPMTTLSAELAASVELPVDVYVLAFGLDARFPGRTTERRITATGVPVRFEHARTDVALRVAFGGNGERFAYRAFGVLGPSRVHVRARTQEITPREGADTRASFFMGLGAEGRVALSVRVWLAAAVGFDWLLGATPYGVFGEVLVDEPRFRVVGSASLVWRIGL